MNSAFSPTLLRHLPLAVIGGVLITYLGCKSESVHYPFLLNMLFSIGLGYLQPRKGWVLALVQILTVFVSYGLILSSDTVFIEHPDVAQFATYLAPIPTLAGSFMGGFLKKAFLD